MGVFTLIQRHTLRSFQFAYQTPGGNTPGGYNRLMSKRWTPGGYILKLQLHKKFHWCNPTCVHYWAHIMIWGFQVDTKAHTSFISISVSNSLGTILGGYNRLKTKRESPGGYILKPQLHKKFHWCNPTCVHYWAHIMIWGFQVDTKAHTSFIPICVSKVDSWIMHNVHNCQKPINV
jgi:hypothetical protein